MTRGIFTKIVFAVVISPMLIGCGLLNLTGPGDSSIEYRVSGTAVRVHMNGLGLDFRRIPAGSQAYLTITN